MTPRGTTARRLILGPIASALALVLSWPGFTPVGAEEADTIAIIVHADSEIGGLSRTALRRLFKGQLQTNHDLVPASSTPVHSLHLVLSQPVQDAFLEEFIGMSSRSFWRYWAGRVLSGENLRPPLKVRKGEDAVQRVATDERVIGVVWASEATEGVRVLSISP